MIKQSKKKTNKTNFRLFVGGRIGTLRDITKYDFVLSYANPTWADWGRLVDNYWGNLNGSDAANKVRETYSCEGSRMYAGTVIRNNN